MLMRYFITLTSTKCSTEGTLKISAVYSGELNTGASFTSATLTTTYVDEREQEEMEREQKVRHSYYYIFQEYLWDTVVFNMIKH